MSELDSMFANMKNVLPASQQEIEGRINLAIIGQQKTGKSTLACTAPGPIFHADMDNRRESIVKAAKDMGRDDIYVKTYFDIAQDNPQAWASLDSDIAMFEYNKQAGKPIPVSYVFDSATFGCKAALNKYFQDNSDGGKTFSIGNTKVIIPRGFDPYDAEAGILLNMAARMMALGNCIWVFHEAPEKDKALSSKDNPVYTGKISVHPPRLKTILGAFNECWRISVDDTTAKFSVRTRPDYNFLGSTNLFIDDNEEPNISKMLEKHKQRKAEKGA